MRATSTVEQWISLAADVVETPRLVANIDKCLKVNLRITDELISELELKNNFEKEGVEGKDNNRLVYKGVPKEIISKYISQFVSHPKHIPFNAKDLSSYIMDSSFDKWTVAVIGGAGEKLSEKYFSESILKYGLSYSKRIITLDDNCLMIYGKRARVGVPGATKIGLDQKTVEKIELDFRSNHKEKTTVPDKPYLNCEREPILMIYPIEIDTEIKSKLPNKKRTFDSDSDAISLIGDYPVIGLGLGFPGVGAAESKKVKYVLNRIGEREMLNFEENDDEDVDDEN